METVLIAGGTGLIGNTFSMELISKGYKVFILTRNVEKRSSSNPNLVFVKWDINLGLINIDAVCSADIIINLAGASIVEKRWSEKRKNEILESRIKSSALIYKTLNENVNKVKTIICASAIGWYGESDMADSFIETAPASSSFLGNTCKRWEAENQKFTELGKRLVIFRIGIVLSKDGGFLTEIKKSLRFGIAAILGNGNQIVSWIHLEDLVRMFQFAIENEIINDVYNAVSNEPVTYKRLMQEYAASIKGRFFIPIHVPSFVLKIVLGEMSSEILKSIKVSNDKIKKTGFTFLYPHISNAFKQLSEKEVLIS